MESNAEILQAIAGLKTELAGFDRGLRQEITQLGQEINGRLDKIGSDIQSLNGRVEEVETRVEGIERWAEAVTEELCASLERERELQLMLDDSNQRSRRCNIRIFNCAEEGLADQTMPVFVEALLREKLQLPETLELKIQRAHRSKPLRPPPNKAPRSIIVNFLEFTTKELVLKLAWEQSKKEKIQLNDKILYFDHDYSPEVMKKRKAYLWIKKSLKTSGTRFQTPYTSMRIHWENGVKTYANAEEAGLELKRRGYNVEEAPPAVEIRDVRMELKQLLGSWQRTPDRQEGDRQGKESEAARKAKARAKAKLQSFQSGRAHDTPREDSQQKGKK